MINSVLEKMSSELIIRDSEKEDIKKSISTLIDRLNYFFRDQLDDILLFGSYQRDTMLPRKFESTSDVDVMIVFKNYYSFKPQTFMNKLKAFCIHFYSTSYVYQDFPTIALELNKIRFELVPTFLSHSTHYIPRNQSEWMVSYPNDFNKFLIQSNVQNNSKIKPVIRLLKLWNVNKNNKKILSYELEKNIAQSLYVSNFYDTSFFDYVISGFKTLKTMVYNDISQYNRVTHTINMLNKAKEYDDNGDYSNMLLLIYEVFNNE